MLKQVIILAILKLNRINGCNSMIVSFLRLIRPIFKNNALVEFPTISWMIINGIKAQKLPKVHIYCFMKKKIHAKYSSF